MIKINERYKCIGDIIDEGLNALFRDLLQPELSLTGTYLDYFRANRQTTKSAQEDYYKNLKKWKNWFAVPCGLDRHKVAAVTATLFDKAFSHSNNCQSF